MANPLLKEPDPQNPLSAGGPTLADAWSYNTKAGGDWLAAQRAQSAQQGLWNPQTGLPTPAGVVNAGGQWANGVLMGTVAPGMKAHQVVMDGLLGRGEKAMPPKTIDVGGRPLPLNEDGSVTLYHATNKEAADQILKDKTIRSIGEPSVYFSTHPTGTGYGEHTVAVRLDPKLLNIDDEFPGGRLDYRIDQPSVNVPSVQRYLPPPKD